MVQGGGIEPHSIHFTLIIPSVLQADVKNTLQTERHHYRERHDVGVGRCSYNIVVKYSLSYLFDLCATLLEDSQSFFDFLHCRS